MGQGLLQYSHYDCINHSQTVSSTVWVTQATLQWHETVRERGRESTPPGKTDNPLNIFTRTNVLSSFNPPTPFKYTPHTPCVLFWLLAYSKLFCLAYWHQLCKATMAKNDNTHYTSCLHHVPMLNILTNSEMHLAWTQYGALTPVKQTGLAQICMGTIWMTSHECVLRISFLCSTDRLLHDVYLQYIHCCLSLVIVAVFVQIGGV